MKYRAIGFDYGGVIGAGGMSGPNFNKRVCQLLDITKERYQEVYFSLNHLINLGEVSTWREFWQIFLEKLGKPEQLEELMAISDEYSRKLLIINQKIVNLVDELKTKGYKTGLLSNNQVENGKALREMGLDKHFDIFHISAETKFMKPSPEAFSYFAEALDVKLQELIFIDDAPKSLSTAEQCGFTPILFESYDKLTTQLRELGVL